MSLHLQIVQIWWCIGAAATLLKVRGNVFSCPAVTWQHLQTHTGCSPDQLTCLLSHFLGLYLGFAYSRTIPTQVPSVRFTEWFLIHEDHWYNQAGMLSPCSKSALCPQWCQQESNSGWLHSVLISSYLLHSYHTYISYIFITTGETSSDQKKVLWTQQQKGETVKRIKSVFSLTNGFQSVLKQIQSALLVCEGSNPYRGWKQQIVKCTSKFLKVFFKQLKNFF